MTIGYEAYWEARLFAFRYVSNFLGPHRVSSPLCPSMAKGWDWFLTSKCEGNHNQGKSWVCKEYDRYGSMDGSPNILLFVQN